MTYDAALWERIRAGDTSAFETFFRETSPRLRCFLRIYSGGQVDAEDIAQEAFLQIWKRPDGFDPDRAQALPRSNYGQRGLWTDSIHRERSEISAAFWIAAHRWRAASKYLGSPFAGILAVAARSASER